MPGEFEEDIIKSGAAQADAMDLGVELVYQEGDELLGVLDLEENPSLSRWASML